MSCLPGAHKHTVALDTGGSSSHIFQCRVGMFKVPLQTEKCIVFVTKHQVILECFHLFILLFKILLFSTYCTHTHVFSFIPAPSISVILSCCRLFEGIFKGHPSCFFIFPFLQYFISGSCTCKISQKSRKVKVLFPTENTAP